jgi:hypothetical protein
MTVDRRRRELSPSTTERAALAREVLDTIGPGGGLTVAVDIGEPSGAFGADGNCTPRPTGDRAGIFRMTPGRCASVGNGAVQQIMLGVPWSSKGSGSAARSR